MKRPTSVGLPATVKQASAHRAAGKQHGGADAQCCHPAWLGEEERAVRSISRDEIRLRRSGQIAGGTSAYLRGIESREDLAVYDPERMRDITDFDYRLWHRHLLPPWLRRRMEIIAAKLVWRDQSGKLGYFGRLVENGIDIKSELSVIASINEDWAERICLCGIWTKRHGAPRNSGRCHDPFFCRLCSWMDHTKLMKEAYGEGTSTLANIKRHGHQAFCIHVSVRDHPKNARAVGRDLEDEDLDILAEDDGNGRGLFSELYEPRPVLVDGTEGREDLFGLETCNAVSLAIQTALRAMYDEGHIMGLKSKLEIALSLAPTRFLPHAHAIATASASISAQWLADELKSRVDTVLRRRRQSMSLRLYTNVRVFAIHSCKHLEVGATYVEKPIPLAESVRAVLDQPQAKTPDGRWNGVYMQRLIHGLLNLHEQLEHVSHGFRGLYGAFYSLRRRQTLGNLGFGKRSLVDEPTWHRVYRQKKKEAMARKRQRVMEEQPEVQREQLRQRRLKADAVRRQKAAKARAPAQAVPTQKAVLRATVNTGLSDASAGAGSSSPAGPTPSAQPSSAEAKTPVVVHPVTRPSTTTESSHRRSPAGPAGAKAYAPPAYLTEAVRLGMPRLSAFLCRLAERSSY